MASPVTLSEIELSTPQLLAVSGTQTTLSASRLGKSRRTFLSIIPLTAGVEVTISFGEQDAIINAGLVLKQSQPFIQSLDVNERGVYQGEIKAIASNIGQVAFVEMFET